MPTSYPADLPAPLLEGFSGTVQMGVVRAEGATDQAQRRVYASMPHSFSLTFVMSAAQWAAWYAWVSVYGYRWFLMDLPTLYAGLAGQDLSPVLIRFTSDISSGPVSGREVQVSVAAETAPSMISQYLAGV